MRIIGAPCMGRYRMSSRTNCPQCGLATGTRESLERHCVRCPNGGMRQMVYAGLIGVLRSILRGVGIPNMAVVTKARGLRTVGATKHGDVIARDFFAEGKHLVIDAMGGRLPRGDLWCGIGGYGLQRARGHCPPPHSRAFSEAPSACYVLRFFNGCCNHLSFF